MLPYKMTDSQNQLLASLPAGGPSKIRPQSALQIDNDYHQQVTCENVRLPCRHPFSCNVQVRDLPEPIEA